MQDLITNHKSREILMYDMGKTEQIWELELQKLAKSTRHGYVLAMNRFLQSVGTDLDGLYQMKLTDLSTGDPRDIRRLERLVSQDMFKQFQNGASASTASRTGKAVNHFMKTQGLAFSLNKNDWPRAESLGQKIVLKQQIRKMYEYASAMSRSRNRALMLLAKDTGLRISDIERMDVSDFIDAREVSSADGEPFKELKPLITRKTRTIAYPIIGPEAVEAVELYLKERGAKRGEPLFIDHDGQRFQVTAMSEQFRRFADYLEDGSRISAHSFRKYHQTQLEASGMNPNIIKKLQGRKIMDSTYAYSKPEDQPGLILKQYIQHYDALRIREEPAIRTLRKEQQDQIAALEAKLEAVMRIVEEKQKQSS